ncbi:unnamed protein product [Gordionus sp. m RMFG-2023]
MDDIPINDCTGGDLSVINKRKRWQINQKKKRTRDSEALQNLLTTQNINTSILASDNVPTISKELNLILTPLQITNPVLTSFNDCTDGDLSVINERKRWQVNQQKNSYRDCESQQNILTTHNKNTSIFASDDIPTISRELILILTPLQVNPNLIPHIATKHDISIKDKQRKKWRLNKRLTRSRITGMQDNKDLRLILTPLQIPSTDISITTTTFPMAPLPCIFRHMFDDHHSPILNIGNMTEICAFCNAKMWNGEKLSKSSCRNIQFSTCCLNGKVILFKISQLPPNLLRYVHTYNPFASQFLRVSSMIATGVPNISLNLKSTPSFDVLYRNKPTSSEIAVLLPGDGSDHIAHRDIILKTLSGPLRRINELHSHTIPCNMFFYFPEAILDTTHPL